MAATVSSADISAAVKKLGILPGDTVLVHSSFKSLGYVEGGADSVIKGFEDVLGREGTLVFPTLCQVDFDNSYKTWYMDKPSDVGYLSEYFRKQMYVYRSDQATHSVAARGKLAYELTHEHTAYGPHICPFGEYAFADSSPWVKMYEMNAKIVFLGVTMGCNTMKHKIESDLVEKLLSGVKDEKKRDGLRAKLRVMEIPGKGIWPFYNSEKMQPLLDSLGLIRHAKCGDAELLCVNAKDSSDAALDILYNDPQNFYRGEMLEWILSAKSE